MDIKLPIRFDLGKILDDYEKVISSVDAVVFDVNMLRPPIYFFKDSSLTSDFYLCMLSSKVDHDPRLFPIKLFLEYNLMFLEQLTELLSYNIAKCHITANVKQEILEMVDFFNDIGEIAVKNGCFQDSLGAFQSAVIDFYGEAGSFMKRIADGLSIFSDDANSPIDADLTIVRCANFLSDDRYSVAIISNDKHVVRYSREMRRYNYRFDKKNLYVLGYSVDKKTNSGELKVQFSYTPELNRMSIDDVFR